MKKITLFFLVIILLASFCGTATALRLVGGSNWADGPINDKAHPLVGMPGIKKLRFEKEKNGILSFFIIFDKEAKKVDAFWAGINDDKSEIREGVKISYLGIVEKDYIYKVELNTKVVKEKTGRMETPINLFLGCYNPRSGYPNLKEIKISWDKKLPINQRLRSLDFK
jgi:hypothetical protein